MHEPRHREKQLRFQTGIDLLLGLLQRKEYVFRV